MVLWGFYGKMARFNHNKHHSSTAKLVFLISFAGLLGATLIADILWASSSYAAPAYLSIVSSWALEKSRIVVDGFTFDICKQNNSILSHKEA